MIDKELFKLRKKALAEAKKYVDPICEIYPLEEYANKSGPVGPFQVPSTYVVPPSEQAVNLVITIADWLLQPNTE